MINSGENRIVEMALYIELRIASLDIFISVMFKHTILVFIFLQTIFFLFLTGKDSINNT